MSAERGVLHFEQGTLLAGKYRVDRLIGEGGMALVYRVVHEALSQPMALKILRAHDVADEARFLNEARIAAKLRSEHVVRVFDVARLDDGRPCFAMELLEGVDLSYVLAAGPLEIATAVDYVVQALDAIAEAHTRGLVHRDLKPANLFLVRRPSGDRLIKVLDFGISKDTKPEAAQSLTQTKAVMGTPLYMAPEQVRNARHVDARSDLWSVGVILYELLEGRPPFEGETYGEVFASILQDDPKPMTRAIPPELAAIIRRCLSRDRKGRPASALDLAQELATFASREGRNSVQKTRVMLLAEEPTGESPLTAPSLPRPASASLARTLEAVTQTFSGPRKRRIAVFGTAVAALAIAGTIGARAVSVRAAAPAIAPASASAPAASDGALAEAIPAPSAAIVTPAPPVTPAPSAHLAAKPAATAPRHASALPPPPRTTAKTAATPSDIVLDRH